MQFLQLLATVWEQKNYWKSHVFYSWGRLEQLLYDFTNHTAQVRIKHSSLSIIQTCIGQTFSIFHNFFFLYIVDDVYRIMNISIKMHLPLWVSIKKLWKIKNVWPCLTCLNNAKWTLFDSNLCSMVGEVI